MLHRQLGQVQRADPAEQTSLTDTLHLGSPSGLCCRCGFGLRDVAGPGLWHRLRVAFARILLS